MQSSDSEIKHLFKKFSEPDSLICVVSRNMIVPRIPGQKYKLDLFKNVTRLCKLFDEKISGSDKVFERELNVI